MTDECPRPRAITMLGCPHVYGIGEDAVMAFTEYGVVCLKQIIADERAAGRAPPPIKSTE